MDYPETLVTKKNTTWKTKKDEQLGTLSPRWTQV